MGLSFGDENSMTEAVAEDLHFAPAVVNSIPETGSISMVDQEQKNDDIEIQSSHDSGTIQQERRSFISPISPKSLNLIQNLGMNSSYNIDS